MKGYIENLSDQIQDACKVGEQFRLPESFKRFSKILFCGMGGSAIGGDIVGQRICESSHRVWIVNRTHQLPSWAHEDTLLILSSYSGNTSEVQSIFTQTLAKKIPMLMISSGGVLAEQARKKKLPLLKLPKGYPPRSAIGYLTCSLLVALAKDGWFKLAKNEIEETIQITKHIPLVESLNLAKKMHGKKICFYGAGLMEPVALRWRTQLAENAKTLASHAVLPEMFHNEIEAWHFSSLKAKDFFAVFLTDKAEEPWLIQKKKVAIDWIKKQKASVLEIEAKGKTPLARIFSSILLADWTSVELALLNQVDPLTIDVIEKVKRVTGKKK